MANDSLAAELARAVPDSLDSIIRGAGRELAQLRLATTADIQALVRPVQAASVKDALDEWRLICIAMKSHPPSFFLVGYAERAGTVWSTSAVNALDPDQHLAVTNNSTYKLLTPGVGEPDSHQLLHICASLHHWKIGVQLGVPHVFY